MPFKYSFQWRRVCRPTRCCCPKRVELMGRMGRTRRRLPYTIDRTLCQHTESSSLRASKFLRCHQRSPSTATDSLHHGTPHAHPSTSKLTRHSPRTKAKEARIAGEAKTKTKMKNVNSSSKKTDKVRPTATPVPPSANTPWRIRTSSQDAGQRPPRSPVF
jgi:hypothetical protein